MAEKDWLYSTQELVDRRIGKFIGNREYGWDVKRQTYKDEKVFTAFTKLRASLRPLVTDDNDYVYNEVADKVAQRMIDTFLMRRAKGQDVEVPQPVAPMKVIEDQQKQAEQSAVDFLADSSEFENVDADMDPVRDLTWIYNHVAIRDVSPSEAPSPGAYAHLKFIQKNDDNMVDFFTKVYPRIIPSKSQIENLGKFNDDGRSNLDLLSQLQAEIEADKD